MDDTRIDLARALGVLPIPPVPRRRNAFLTAVLLYPAMLVFVLLVLVVGAAILIGPSASAAGGCGGG